jgi:hypothetical protein
MSKIFRTAEEWADFFIEDRDWTPCMDDYIGYDEVDTKKFIIEHLGDGDGKRIPSAKKLDSLIITSYDNPEMVYDVKPFDMIEGGIYPNELVITHEYDINHDGTFSGSKIIVAHFVEDYGNKVTYRVHEIRLSTVESYVTGMSYEFTSQYNKHKKPIFFGDVLFLNKDDGHVYTGRSVMVDGELKGEYLLCNNNIEFVMEFGDEDSPELRRLPSINEEDGSVDNMKWTNYRIVKSYCFIECPEDNDCDDPISHDCDLHDCNSY